MFVASLRRLSDKVDDSKVGMVIDLWRHHTYISRRAWLTVYPKLFSNISFSNGITLFLYCSYQKLMYDNSIRKITLQPTRVLKWVTYCMYLSGNTNK